jgi:hypothetical protein
MNRRKPRRRSLDRKGRFSPVVSESLEHRLLLSSVAAADPAPVSFYITNTNNSGVGSLRQAIMDANAAAGFNPLVVQIPTGFSHWISLSSALPVITDSISLSNLELSPFFSGFDGLVLAADNSSISSVTVHGFRSGIVVRGNNNQLSNTVYGNSVDGLRIESGTGNEFTHIAGWGNGHLLINLGTDDAPPNDPLDADTGPNELQNWPVISAAASDYTGTLLSGRLDSKPDTTYHIGVYGSDNAAGALGEARSFLGQFDVTTDDAGNAQFGQAVSNYTVGHYITATATDPAGNTSELSAPTRIAAASTVVTNTNARGAGSLYGAIVNSKANAGPDTITFNIPGAGVHRILLSAADVFPVWDTSQLTIDASTQPGYAGSPVVELVGSAGSTGGGGAAGLAFYTGSAIVVRGLAIGGFQTGIDMRESSGRIEGNYIGLAADGSQLPNEVGVRFKGSILASTTIGGTLAQARNVISGNTGAGIQNDVFVGFGRTIDQFPANYVQGNYVGVGADGITPLGNGGGGIVTDGATAFIGGVGAGEANVIAYNGGNGVTVVIDPNEIGSGQRTSVRGNAIYGNAKLGIDLGNDGVTANDSGDGDAGANTLQNFPVVSAASSDGASTLVSGSFNSAAGAAYTLDFYSGPAADASGAAQGRTYLGSATVTTDPAGNATFVASLGVPTPPGQVVTATATTAASATSEFSSPLWVSLPGDANRDRAVDFQDLSLLAQSYNTSGGRTWSQGDFTGDGAVDFLDLAKLAQNYNTSLPGTPAPGAAVDFQAALATAFAPTAATQVTVQQKPKGDPKPKSVILEKPKPPVIRKPKTSPAPRPPAPKAAVAPSLATSVFGMKPIRKPKPGAEVFA